MKEEEEPKKEPIDVPRKYCLVTAMKTHSSSGRSYRPPMVCPFPKRTVDSLDLWKEESTSLLVWTGKDLAMADRRAKGTAA